MKTLFAALVISVLSAHCLFSQLDPKQKGLNSITESSVTAQLEFLASDWMEGRETGTKGNLMAAAYIASMFKIYGIQPAGDKVPDRNAASKFMSGLPVGEYRSYFQTFPLMQYKPGDKQNLTLISGEDNKSKSVSFQYNTDYKVYSVSQSCEITAPIVFVGYGINDKDKDYNDFEDVDVRGKFILRLAGYPGYLDTTSRGYLKYKGERPGQIWMGKDKAAKNAGAIGVIEILSKDAILNWSENEPFRINLPYYEGDKELAHSSGRMQIIGDTLSDNLISLSISLRAANEIVKDSKVSFSKFEESVKNSLESASVIIKGKVLNLISSVDSKIITARNVLGMIEGENKDEIIVIGGHYDHMGMAEGYIWNGSDDNASGTVGVMTLAKAFAETGLKPKKTILFAAWTGEEEGLLGSRYFVNYSSGLENKIVLNLNYDMISRNAKTDTMGLKCSMVYSKAFTELMELTETNNNQQQFGLKIEYRASDRPSGGSDHSSFAQKNIPVMYFMAGFHDDYHRPGDTADKADIRKMTNIIKLGFLNLWDIVNGDQNYFSTINK